MTASCPFSVSRAGKLVKTTSSNLARSVDRRRDARVRLIIQRWTARSLKKRIIENFFGILILCCR